MNNSKLVTLIILNYVLTLLLIIILTDKTIKNQKATTKKEDAMKFHIKNSYNNLVLLEI